MAAVSAYGNDDGYDQVFARQLNNLASPDDVLVAISTSGNSPNVLNAVEAANQMGAITIGFTGRDGGMLGSMVQIEVRVPNQFADQIEDVHLIVAHLITRSLKQLAQPTVVMIPQEQTYDAGIQPLAINNRHPVTIEGTNRISALPLNWPPEMIANPGCGLGALLLHLVANFNATSGSFLLLDEAGQIIDSAVAYTGQLQSPEGDRIARFLNRGLAGWVVEHQVGTLVANTHWDSRWLPSESESTPKPRSVLCAPLVKSDRVTGVVALTRPGSLPFNDGDLAILSSSSRDLYDVLVPCEKDSTSGD
jgi:D-sedoheptulose 7-phosphate isomerase